MIYFIKIAETNHVKIGTSKNVKKRLDTIQSASPYKLILLKTIEGGHGLEAELHKKFSHLHVRGEWFNLTEELNNFINNNHPIEITEKSKEIKNKEIGEKLSIPTIVSLGYTYYYHKGTIFKKQKHLIKYKNAEKLITNTTEITEAEYAATLTLHD